MVLMMALGLLSAGVEARARGQGFLLSGPGLLLLLCTLCYGFSGYLLFSSPTSLRNLLYCVSLKALSSQR